MAYVQPVAAPAWLTLKVCPALVIEPERAVEALGSTEYWTTPLPAPLAPDVTWIHVAFATAVQPQPAAVVTVTLLLPPLCGNDAGPGEMAYVHVTAPLWLTVNVSPPIVIVPIRDDEDVLASTEY